VASFIGGFYVRNHVEESFRARNVRIIQSDIKKSYKINITYPENPEGENSHWPSVIEKFVERMCCTEEWNIDELYLFITSVYHWKSLARKHFDLVLEMLNGRYSDTRIGELDEEFVWERNHGDFFTLGTQTWRIDNINDRSV
jgi:hypothetical protein